MIAPSKYDSATNPLGPQKLQRTYLIAADNFVIELLYANTILRQPDLDVSQLSPGLGTAINAFQVRMKNNAQFVLGKVSADFRITLADVTNFGDLVSLAFSAGEVGNIQNAYQDSNAAGSIREAVLALAREAGETGIHVSTLNDYYATVNNNINQYVNDYKESMAEAIALLGESAKQASSEIDDLQAAITQNVKDIVEGGDEVGGAVTKLVTGILTKITGESNDPKLPKPDSGSGGGKDKDDKDEEEKEDEEDEEDDDEEEDEEEEEDDKKPVGKTESKPENSQSGGAANVDFAVQAIHAGQEGMAKASTAAQALNTNNTLLAEAYQKLARENTLMAIAKVMQVQNQLFLNGLAQLKTDAQALKTEWATVESAYADFSRQIGDVNEQSEAADMGSSAQAAQSLWKALGNQVDYVKNAMTGLG